MSTFLTKQEQNIAEKYLQFCENFGIPPMKNYEELIAKNMRVEDLEQSRDQKREEAIAIYKTQCRNLGFPISGNLALKSTGEIWDYILRDADAAINNEFCSEFAKNKDFILRKKIKIAIKTLYDEGLYVKKEQTIYLFACENDDEEIYDEYRKLGGKEKLLALDEIVMDEYEEEEVTDDEEDF